MIHGIKRVIFSISLMLILIIGVGVFLLTTTPGLYTTIKLGKLFLPGQLVVRQLSGSLANHFTIGELEYRILDITINAKDLSLSWDFNALLRRHVEIHSITAKKFMFNTEHKTPIYITLKLPFTLNADHAAVD